jgi:CRISPR-associated protein Cmr6
MKTPNIGWLYYKDYLRKGTNATKFFEEAADENDETKRKKYFEDHFAEKNKTILEQEFSPNVSKALISELAKSNIPLKTIYPGLSFGTGYTHEINEMGEFKLGFFFDHATGYPCIPGNTVKGCLRSMFPQKERKEVADKDEKYNYLATVIRELSAISAEVIRDNKLGLDFDPTIHVEGKQFIDFLEREIFDGTKPARKEEGRLKMKDGEIVFQSIGIYDRDIFFDAYLVETNHPAINRWAYHNLKPFIGDDYITPHINRKKPELSPFTNPVPLMFLKILPEVTIQFQFDLKSGLLSAEQKKELFQRLLLDFGIGAKTNVGYGQFDEVEIKPVRPTIPENSFPKNAIPFLKKDKDFSGTVSSIRGTYYMIEFKVNDEVCIIRKRMTEKLVLELNEKVSVICKNDYLPNNPNIGIKKIV